jgi:hypothetical protein
MLISMPQGTSTIFGAFQAISALHFRDFGRIRPALKLVRAEKFASEIFPIKPCCGAKYRGWNTAFDEAVLRQGAFGRERCPDKAVVSAVQLSIRYRRPNWISVMPKYFFNTRIGNELIVDPEGEVLRNPDRAWEVARQMILEVLKSEGTQPALMEAVIEVTDVEGEIVLEFPFTEALLDMPDQSATRH